MPDPATSGMNPASSIPSMGGGALPLPAGGASGNTAAAPQTIGTSTSDCCGPSGGSGGQDIDVTSNFTVVQTSTPVTAQYGQLVEANTDPGGVAFAVNLPAANAASVAGGNAVIVKNIATGFQNGTVAVNVTPAGADTIGGVAGVQALYGDNFLYLVSDGVSNWIAVSQRLLYDQGMQLLANTANVARFTMLQKDPASATGYTPLQTPTDGTLAIGVSIDTNVAAPSTVRAITQPGTITTGISDQTAIPRGAAVYASNNFNGTFSAKPNGRSVGIALAAAAAGGLNQFALLWLGSGGVGGSPVHYNAFVQTTPQGNNYNASLNDLVSGDPTNGAYTVTLPAANSTVPGGPNEIIVKNESASANAITVQRSGADTIDGGAASVVLQAREVVRLVSDGASNWIIV